MAEDVALAQIDGVRGKVEGHERRHGDALWETYEEAFTVGLENETWVWIFVENLKDNLWR